MSFKLLMDSRVFPDPTRLREEARAPHLARPRAAPADDASASSTSAPETPFTPLRGVTAMRMMSASAAAVYASTPSLSVSASSATRRAQAYPFTTRRATSSMMMTVLMMNESATALYEHFAEGRVSS